MDTPVKTIAHFGLELDLPKQVTIQPYKSLNLKKQKKNKDKYTKFTYYKTSNSIQKVLYKDQRALLNQGSFPFTTPQGKIQLVKLLSDQNPQRLAITQAAYIGHEGKTLYVMKMKDVPLETGKLDLDTQKISSYETIALGNEQRFNQFMKLLGSDPKRSQMSVRVIINETDAQKPQVIDYEFFYREDEIKNTKAFQVQIKQ